MPKALVILGSLNAVEVSASTKVANALLDTYTTQNPTAAIDIIDATGLRDIALTKNIIAGKIDTYEQSVITQRGALLEQFKAADLVVIATPMFNFGLPGQVKEVIDTFAVAGETFKYLDVPDADGNVSVGLTEGKKLVLIEAMGGFYNGPKGVALEQVKLLFNFIGVKDISYIPIQGTAVPWMDETEKCLIKAKALAEKL